MSPQGFLAAVLPPPGHGHYCAAAFDATKKNHKFVDDVEDVEPFVQPWVSKRQDVYFALSTFATAGKRTAENATYIRAIAIDMDGYASKRAAAEALDAFLKKTGLDCFGNPWIVASGGGLHCYWTFIEAVPIAIWRPVAERFKRLCRKESLSIDMTVTADAARVLRIPGTKNFKPKYDTPRDVTLLVSARHIDFLEFSTLVTRLVGDVAPPAAEIPALDLPGTRPTRAPDGAGVKLLEGAQSVFKTLITRTVAGSGCAQLAYYVEHAKEDGLEPLWRGWLSEAKYCTDGERAVRWLSQQHPYDEARMQTKLREIKGPYPCVKFDSENPGVCEKCPHFGNITNPLALGREMPIDTAPKQIELPQHNAEDPEAPPIIIDRPEAPYGFAYGANGGVYSEEMVEEADGTKRKHQVKILSYELFIIDLLNRDGEHTVHMLANRPNGAIDILVPQRYAVSKDELLKTLAQQNIIAAHGPGNDKRLFEYVRACIERASIGRTPVKTPAQCGWQDDGSIVYSGKIFRPDGTTRTVPMPDLANLTRAMRPVGTLQEWRRLPHMLLKRRLYSHLAIMGIAFGAPLMRFTGLNGLTFHAGSTNSGSGKSLALSLMNSVWGHPIRMRCGKATSPVTMQQRMGNLNSFPFSSDEITHKSRHDMEWFPGMCFDVAEGAGKEKSETHHNRERLNNVSWCTIALFTSNTYMHDYMSGARAHTSQGELMRMLEWTPEQELQWTPEEAALLTLLNDNHGVGGERYVRWLVQNKDLADRITRDTIAMLKNVWQATGNERFWLAGCGAIVAGCTMASSKYAGIIDLPIEEIINALKAMVDKARSVIRSTARTAEDVLNAFTRDNYGSFVVLRQSKAGEQFATLGDGKEIDQTITRNKVLGRIEHEIDHKGYTEYFIEEQVLKTHCVAMSFGYDSFRKQLLALYEEPIRKGEGYKIDYMRKDMMSKTKGPQMRVRVMRITRPVDVDANISVE